MNEKRDLKVAIDAQIMPGTSGGVAQAIRSLIHSLGQLPDDSERYTIIVSSSQQYEWLKPILGPNQDLVVKTQAVKQYGNVQNGYVRRTFSDLFRRSLELLRPSARYIRGLMNARRWPEVPISNGFYESLGCDVVHFPTQHFVLCALPTIYNPHDLQHLHYPQFWTPSIIAWRETIYPAGCHHAHTVVVGSQWTKEDIVRHYRINPEKVQVIPEAPPTELYPEPTDDYLIEVKRKYGLEESFSIYPAVTWPHKNHLRLLEALAFLRDTRGLTIHVVCTGSPFESFWPRIEQCMEALHLGRQVKFLGFVPEQDLRAIYRLSQFLVMPTLFEASSLPIFEAWLEGLPVACSHAAALPDQVKDAALFFEPNDVESIANSIAELATNVDLQQDLRRRGHCRLKDFSLERTAKVYRAVYRRAATFPLTEEDRCLLAWDWMREPQRERELHLP